MTHVAMAQFQMGRGTITIRRSFRSIEITILHDNQCTTIDNLSANETLEVLGTFMGFIRSTEPD